MTKATKICLLLWAALLLGACSVWKQKARTEQRSMQQQHTRHTTLETRHQAAQTGWRLLQESIQDSLLFTVWIETQGAYTIHPDSGIRGDKARIAVRGLRKRQVNVEDSSRYQQMEVSQASLSAAASAKQRIVQIEQQKEKRSKGYTWFGWIPLVVTLLLILFYKRRM